MQVTFIPSSEINSDLGVVNAARVSLHKKSEWQAVSGFDDKLSGNDQRLLHYLVTHNHWTPFAHSRLYFTIKWKYTGEELWFYKTANQAGFAHTTKDSVEYVKGSVYAWYNNLPSLPVEKSDYVVEQLHHHYPATCTAFDKLVPTFTHGHGMINISEEYVLNKELWHIACATLLIKVPIFIARQIRTSQVGMAYSDLLVQGEGFVFNEVSRRYVDEQPEFYTIPQWRVREGKKVKQGSTGVASEELNHSMNMLQTANQRETSYTYATEHNISPEQARSLLPQSLYTEFYITATLHRWAQFIALRSQSDVQQETRDAVQLAKDELVKQFPAWQKEYKL